MAQGDSPARKPTSDPITSATSAPVTQPSRASRPTGNPKSRISPESIVRIKNLELRAKTIVEGFMSGLHRSPYHGFSVEFTDYRQYTPGDDPRYLDWKLFARNDRYYIKRFEDETNLRCYLLVDLSRSMGYGSTADYNKAEYAKTLAATIAYFLSRQRDAVGLTTFEQDITDMIPARFRPGHLRRLMMCLEQATSGTDTDLSLPLERIAQTVSKRGMIVLISDLLVPTDGLKTKLGYLRSQGHDVTILRTLDPTEINFKFDSASMFRDLESGREIYVDPVAAAADYTRRFTDHETAVKEICDGLGVDFFTIQTDQPFESALFDFIQSRSRMKKSAGRRNPPSSSTAGGTA